MRIKTVQRYYCDHCNKGGFKKALMESHESSCCKNPKRFCMFCHDFGLNPQPLEKLISLADEIPNKDAGQDVAIQALRDAADECPACMLAAILQRSGPDYDQPYVDWVYRDEISEFHKEHGYPHDRFDLGLIP